VAVVAVMAGLAIGYSLLSSKQSTKKVALYTDDFDETFISFSVRLQLKSSILPLRAEILHPCRSLLKIWRM
jgi:hypothetical protein